MKISAQTINDTLESRGVDTSGALYDGLNVYIDDDSIEVIIKNSALYGRIHEIGVHCQPETMEDVLRSIDDAASKMFPKVFVYVNLQPTLSLVK